MSKRTPHSVLHQGKSEFTLFAAIPSVQDRQPALRPGGGDRRAVRGGGLEAALPAGPEHGAARIRGVHTATLRQSSGTTPVWASLAES